MEQGFDQINQEPKVESIPAKGGFNWDKHFLPLSILVAAVLISGTILYNGNGVKTGSQTGTISDAAVKVPGEDELFDETDHILGNPNAKVVIVEFSDFQCPYCRLFWTQTLPQLKAEYIDSGKAQLIYRDFPLTNIHPMAVPSALAAECAGEQSKYFEYHDKLFSEQNKKEPNVGGFSTISYTQENLIAWAGEIGLNVNSFRGCLTSQKYLEEVESDTSDASDFGVTGTPGFFINGHYINGAQPFSVFKKIIDEQLN